MLVLVVVFAIEQSDVDWHQPYLPARPRTLAAASTSVCDGLIISLSEFHTRKLTERLLAGTTMTATD